MALSGGKGNSRADTSSTNTTTSIDSTTNTVDNRQVQGDGAVFGGNVNVSVAPGSSVQGGVAVSTTDYGAIQAAGALALKALDSVTEGAAANNQTTQDAISKSLQLAANNSAAQGAETTQLFLKVGAAVAVAAVIAYALKRRG